MKYKETKIFITKAPEVDLNGALQVSGEGTPWAYDPALALHITIYKEGRSDAWLNREARRFEGFKKLPAVGIVINFK